jgi:hypothetical protein
MTLDIVRIPVLNDNYVWSMREPQSGAVGVVDPAVAGPVFTEVRHHEDVFRQGCHFERSEG